MRDPKRINKFCDELKKYWGSVPDWRFGQLIINIFGSFGVDPWFIEDDDMIEMIKAFFKEEGI